LLAYTYRIQGKWDEAFSEMEKAISINPVPDHFYLYAAFLNQVGRPEDAIEKYKKAIKRVPIPPAYARNIAVRCYFQTEEYDKARDEGIRLLDHIEKFEPEYNIYFVHLFMTATYAMLGQMEKASKHAAEVKRLKPRFSLDRHIKQMLIKKGAYKDRLISALRQAGLM